MTLPYSQLLIYSLFIVILYNIRYHFQPSCCSGSALGHRSLPLVFESRGRHICWLFRFWLRFITFVGHSAHLVYHAHKSGRKTSIKQKRQVKAEKFITRSGNITNRTTNIFSYCGSNQINLSTTREQMEVVNPLKYYIHIRFLYFM